MAAFDGESLHTLPDAEAQCVELAGMIRPVLTPETLLVGIHTGGAWVAKRVAEILKLDARIGLLDISFYRDDFQKRGLHPHVKPTSLPLDVDGRAVMLIDDVLFTGRTTRAAINELFDYGRPASIKLAVLADRGLREMPIGADFCAWRLTLPSAQELMLGVNEAGRLSWRIRNLSDAEQRNRFLADSETVTPTEVRKSAARTLDVFS